MVFAEGLRRRKLKHASYVYNAMFFANRLQVSLLNQHLMLSFLYVR